MTLALPASESRRPPRNAFGRTGLGGFLLQTLQSFADLQVCTVRRDVAQWLSGRRGRLLEVGCGDQPYRSLVPAACRYVAIDRRDADDNFDMARRDNVLTYVGDAFPIDDASVDALFHTEVLEHVYAFRPFMDECRRVLKPGGAMMFTVPFQARYHFAPNDYFRYTPAALQALLAEAGFDAIDIRSRGSDITVAAYKVAAVTFRWAVGDWRGKCLAVLSLPLAGLALAIAHLSLWLRLGSPDDCLGYTVEARAAPV